MKDRYLFKAKRIDNGEWVQGVPFEIEGKTIILIKDNENLLRTHYLEENMWTAEIYAIEVDPSTICRCTGLKDKNGKLIWENDIIKRLDIRDIKEPSIGIIEYDVENTSFLIHWFDIVNYSPTFPWKSRIEVIGNIFYNPDLLESEE